MGCHFLPPGNFPGPGFESTSLKAYNQFYDDLFSKKNKPPSTNTAFGDKSFCSAVE